MIFFFFSGVSAPGIGAKYGHFWADHVVDVANVEKKNGFNPKNPKKFDKKSGKIIGHGQRPV